MQTATFRGRRGVEFRAAAPARARGWQVVFDKPPLFPIGEAFANLVAAPEAEALGIIYDIDDSDLEHVKLTEGVMIGNYAPVELTVEMLASGEPVSAISLTSDRRDPRLRPSTRYMDLIIEGAHEHGLPAEYIDYLRTVPAKPASVIAQHARPLLDLFLRKRS